MLRKPVVILVTRGPLVFDSKPCRITTVAFLSTLVPLIVASCSLNDAKSRSRKSPSGVFILSLLTLNGLKKEKSAVMSHVF